MEAPAPRPLSEIARSSAARGEQNLQRAGERVKPFVDRFKNATARAREAAGLGVKIGLGLPDPEIRADLNRSLEHRKTEAWNDTKDKFRDIRDAIGHKKDSAISASLNKLGAIKAEVGKRVVNPTVEGTKTIGNRVKETGLRAGLFARSTAENVKTGVTGAASTGVETVQAGVEGVKTKAAEVGANVRLGAEAAGARATQWSRDTGEYFVNQGQQLYLDMAQTQADIAAAYYGAPGALVEGAQKGAVVARNAAEVGTRGVQRGAEAVVGRVKGGFESFKTNFANEIADKNARAQAARERSAQIGSAQGELRAVGKGLNMHDLLKTGGPFTHTGMRPPMPAA